METLICGMPTVHAQVTASVQSGIRLRRSRLMETLVCGMPTVHTPVTASVQSGMPLTRSRLMEILVCGMPTVHTPVTASVQSGMPLMALTVNGNTCLWHAYPTCPSHCISTVWDAAYGAYG